VPVDDLVSPKSKLTSPEAASAMTILRTEASSRAEPCWIAVQAVAVVEVLSLHQAPALLLTMAWPYQDDWLWRMDVLPAAAANVAAAPTDVAQEGQPKTRHQDAAIATSHAQHAMMFALAAYAQLPAVAFEMQARETAVPLPHLPPAVQLRSPQLLPPKGSGRLRGRRMLLLLAEGVVKVGLVASMTMRWAMAVDSSMEFPFAAGTVAAGCT